MFFAQCCCAEGEHVDMKLPEEMWSVTEENSVSAAVPQGKEEKPKEVMQFHVSVERTGDTPLGMDLSSAGPVLMVSSIAHENTLIGAWNNTCEKSQRVDRLDRLVSVNGFSGAKAKDTLDKLKVSKGQLVLVFERPYLFEAVFEVADGEGLGLAMSAGPNFILINSAQEGGPVQKHNAVAPDEQKIKFGTRILEVNGQTGTGPELTRLARSVTGKATLKFVNWS